MKEDFINWFVKKRTNKIVTYFNTFKDFDKILKKFNDGVKSKFIFEGDDVQKRILVFEMIERLNEARKEDNVF